MFKIHLLCKRCDRNDSPPVNQEITKCSRHIGVSTQILKYIKYRESLQTFQKSASIRHTIHLGY